MNRKQETGPIYGVGLLDTLPLDGGMIQQLPSRDDLEQASRRFMRVAAGYEVLMAHYQRAMAKLDEHDKERLQSCERTER